MGWLKRPGKPVPSATNKNDLSAEALNTFTNPSWKTAFTPLKSLVNESDINLTIPPLSRLSWTEAHRPLSSTKLLLSVLSTSDCQERMLFSSFQSTNYK